MPHRPRKQKPIRFRNRGVSPLTPATPEKRQLLLDLALELQQMTIETMERFGVSRKEQMGTYRRALRGLGSKDRVDVEISWPSGHHQIIKNVAADQILKVREAESQ